MAARSPGKRQTRIPYSEDATNETPKVISILDYSKGFGHTNLVRP